MADCKETVIEKNQTRELPGSYCTICNVCSVLSVQDFTGSSQRMEKLHLRVAAKNIAKQRPSSVVCALEQDHKVLPAGKEIPW